ncbi:MAG: HNH endonuclease [Nostoc sp.]|uniref:HNH endonuclease n=1 Tax=Nostoc sp. TaxID=1180 RepID=UPI002FF7F488
MRLKNFFANILATLFEFFRPKRKQVRRYGKLGHRQKDHKRPHLIAKYGMKCFWCRHELTPETLTIDHYIPLSKGGSNKIKNLRLACNGCNNKRGDAMPEETHQIIAEQSNIRFPSHWKKPKYQLGQLVKQGEIIGVEYHYPASLMADEFGEGWTYWVLIDKHAADVESFSERNITPLSNLELQQSVQSEIEFHQSKLAALTEQLTQVDNHD